jgi:hypothetical protein
VLRHTERITIELSNQCNMAHLHKECPLHGQKEKRWISDDIVTGVFDFLESNKYSGFVAFHNYNEPLIDERLIPFAKQLVKKCPSARPFILTNGLLLDQKKLDELVSAGFKKIYVSCYSGSEHKRLKSLKAPSIKYKAKKIKKLDKRLEGYEKSEKAIKKPCYSPLGEIVIRCTGEVVLCCRDWKSIHVFGNLNEETLEAVLRKGTMQRAYKRLSKGNRYFDICRICRMRGRYGV